MRNGLGRGLDSLFSVYEDYAETTRQINEMPKEVNQNVSRETLINDGVVNLEISQIDPNANQPRKKFDENAMNELADSIKVHGVIQPIIVVKVGTRFMIIAGERRWRASKIAGVKTIPAIVKNYNERDIREISIIENLQREDLNAIEMAKAFKSLMDEYNWTQEVVAERLGKSRPLIANTVRLLSLQPEVIQMIEKGELSAGHARSLVVVSDRQQQLKLARMACEKKLTVRDLEQATKTSGKQNSKSQISGQTAELRQFSQECQRILGTKVSIIGNESRGRVIVDYFSRDDLERIYNQITK